MRKRVRIAVALLLVAIAGVIIRETLREREPVYQGKRLSVWLDQYAANHGAGGNRELEGQAEAAIRQIGTNAIPFYLELIATKDSPLKIWLRMSVPETWLSRLHLHASSDYRLRGELGIMALGGDAKPAIPGLIASLSDKNPDVRFSALEALRVLGPLAADASPSLIKCLRDPDLRVAVSAVESLDSIRQKPEQAVPMLMELLARPTDPQRQASFGILHHVAIRSLGQFGAQAKPAVPVLLGFLNDTKTYVRLDATNALKAIDPEAAAKAGVR
jgi:hypothetical protein